MQALENCLRTQSLVEHVLCYVEDFHEVRHLVRIDRSFRQGFLVFWRDFVASFHAVENRLIDERIEEIQDRELTRFLYAQDRYEFLDNIDSD